MSQTNLPAVIAERGISIEVYSAVKNSIFPGAADESIVMAWDYCAARKLDIMLKPVHLVPMWIKDKNNGDKGSMRDVVMPGIGLYRIQADRAGNYAGMDAPKFGDLVTSNLSGMEIKHPEWCEITVYKSIGDRLVGFTAREYWIENYATAGKDTLAPNVMWKKRPRGQITKCAEAQALRKAWPELGSHPTAEEMEGKILEEKDITPVKPTPAQIGAASLPQADAADTTDYKSIIADLELVAKENGAEAFKADWKSLSVEAKAAIGIPERDRILLLAKTGTVVDGDATVIDDAKAAEQERGGDE